VIETSIIDTNTSSQTFTCASFIGDFLLQRTLHVSHPMLQFIEITPMLQFIEITDLLLSTAALFSRF